MSAYPISQTSDMTAHVGTSRGVQARVRRTFATFGNFYRVRGMGDVLHFRDRSGLGLFRNSRRALFPDKLWPDAMPVFGAEIPATNLSVRGLLDGDAVLGAGQAPVMGMAPLPHLGNVLDFDGGGQLGDAQGLRAVEIGMKVHDRIVIANAISMQAAFAIGAIANLPAMDADDISEFRRERLAALVKDRYDNSADGLGKALDLKNGAFIRQMLKGMRPITEKTAAAIEKLPGLAGWFGVPVKTETGKPFVLTNEERDAILGMRAARAAREAGTSIAATNVTALHNRRAGESGGMRRTGNPGKSGKVPQRRATDKTGEA